MAMATVEGTHAQRGGGRPVRYRVEYEVVGTAIHFRATFDGGSASHEGEFDFDPAKLEPPPRSTPSCRTTSRSPTGTSRPSAARARAGAQLPAQRPDQVERVVAAGLGAHREALRDAVDRAASCRWSR